MVSFLRGQNISFRGFVPPAGCGRKKKKIRRRQNYGDIPQCSCLLAGSWPLSNLAGGRDVARGGNKVGLALKSGTAKFCRDMESSGQLVGRKLNAYY